MDTRSQHFMVALAILALLLPLLAGCAAKGSDSTRSGEDLKGTITVSGAFALYPAMVRWGEEFSHLHPHVDFDISAGGAGKGLTDALNGAVDIGMVSRAITSEEEAKGAFWIAVTKDAVFPAVSEKNPVLADLLAKGVTKETFVGIYVTGEVTTWGQVVGRPAVTDPIHVYTRSDSCGAAEVWAKYLGNKKQEDLTGIGVSSDPGIMDAVIKDPLGIGYNNLNYAFDAKTGQAVAGSAVVPIDVNADGKAGADEMLQAKPAAVTAVATGCYPSPPARLLNLVTNGKPTGLVRDFFSWVLSDGQKLLAEVGYVPLTPEQLADSKRKLE
jgi:phosphate transport system substrate-binding protein